RFLSALTDSRPPDDRSLTVAVRRVTAGFGPAASRGPAWRRQGGCATKGLVLPWFLDGTRIAIGEGTEEIPMEKIADPHPRFHAPPPWAERMFDNPVQHAPFVRLVAEELRRQGHASAVIRDGSVYLDEAEVGREAHACLNNLAQMCKAGPRSEWP